MLKMEKQLFDNVHGYIGVTKQELRVIDTGLFQRLRRIKQLGQADMVYPGATHTRFAHSLGTMFMIDQFARNAVKADMDDDSLQKLRLAALMHDIGHYPFSHTLEHEIEEKMGGVSHEKLGSSIISRFFSERLGTFSSREITDMISGGKGDAYGLLISSAIDADKSDYLLRDSYNTGVPYGRISVASLMRILTFEKGRIIFEKDEAPVESFLLGRYHLYRSVVHHKAVIAFGLMLQRIYNLMVSDGAIMHPKELMNSDEEDICGYTDDAVYSAMKSYSESGKGAAGYLARMFLRREPLALAYSATAAMEKGESQEAAAIMELEKNGKLAERIEEEAGISMEWIFPTTLRTLALIDEEKETKIYIRKEGRLIPLIESSALVLRMIGKKALHDSRVYTRKKDAKIIRKAITKILKR